MQIKWLTSLTQVSAAQWDGLFTAADDNPFCRHAFLLALEQGGSVDTASSSYHSGWISQHLTVWQQDTLLAAVPGYYKLHSYGEYLFDWQIAEAYRQYQLPYYPKWIAAIPFTPVSGPRLGILHDTLSATLMPILCDTLKQRLATKELHSVQWLYPCAGLAQQLAAEGFLSRHDVQFLWHNEAYGSFDDFLQRLNARKRKQIRAERSNSGAFTLATLHGNQLTDNQWQAIIRCYQATYIKRSGHQGYITEASFKMLAKTMADSLVVFAALAAGDEQQIVAAALCFRSNNTLYGRYWGTLIPADCLHFELCYYQGIDYCIRHKLEYFDAGAQGEHKLKRGFVPVTRYGSYLFADTPLTGAIADYFTRETAQLQHYKNQAMQALPFKQLPTDMPVNS
ncbi:GNAT family N-acetyltransferase [Rheinheimera muenzenbergensis]|uniref:GNAT family N-acetyltransferase n=1 Tax=Rheinheimera muenzenbergensis TaxID=1193628 RepID=A0ABU8C793_9GAMM